MLRHHVPQAYFWILLWFVLAIVLLLMEAVLLPQPVLAIATQLKDIMYTFLSQMIQSFG
ncbi:hypothetical protein ACQ4M4_05855 [Leptolyngbya sp. AN02str]|uniref:hypothetical protein n=1 Tax=Leptolyngbya sp. AN02str TaxID=3423363 RepID=UPI003D313CD6